MQTIRPPYRELNPEARCHYILDASRELNITLPTILGWRIASRATLPDDVTPETDGTLIRQNQGGAELELAAERLRENRQAGTELMATPSSIVGRCAVRCVICTNGCFPSPQFLNLAIFWVRLHPMFDALPHPDHRKPVIGTRRRKEPVL